MFNKKLLSSIDLGKYKKKNPYKKDIILDPMGQWKHPGKNTRIPSSSITMKGVNYPVLGVSNTGQKQMMQPGKEYNFPGADYVDEYPQMKKGGSSEQKIIFSPMEGGCPDGQYWTGSECKPIPPGTKIVYSQEELDKLNISKKEQKRLYNEYISRKQNQAIIEAAKRKKYGPIQSGEKFYKTFEDIPAHGFRPMMSYGPSSLTPDGLGPGIPSMKETMIDFKTYKKMLDKSSVKPIGYKGHPGGGHFYPIYEKPSNYILGYNREEKKLEEEPIELPIIDPPLLENKDLGELQVHDYSLPDSIEAPQYKLDPYKDERLRLSVTPGKSKRVTKRGILSGGQRYKHTEYKPTKDLEFGKKEVTKPIAALVQKLTGYDPKYFEGYENEEGEYIPGELDYGNATGSEMEFRGAASLRDYINQKKYEKEYAEYDKKLDTWLEQYAQSKKKQEQGQAFKKGGAKKKYTSDIINSTNYLFAEHPLFKKKKQSKKRIYDPKAKYYQFGGLTRLTNLAGKTLKLPPAILNESNILPIISNLKPASSISKDLKIGPGVKGLLADPRYRSGIENGFPLIEYDFPSASIRQLGDYKYQPYSEGWWAEHDMKTALEQPQWVPGKEDFFTDQEIVDLVKQQKDYDGLLAAFNKMNPESDYDRISRMMLGDFSRDELFANLFPNASIPNFRSKFLTPKQNSILNNFGLQNITFQDKGKLNKPNLINQIAGRDGYVTYLTDTSAYDTGLNHFYNAYKDYHKPLSFSETKEFLIDHGFEKSLLDEINDPEFPPHMEQLDSWKMQILKDLENEAIKKFKKNIFESNNKFSKESKLTGLDAYNKMLNQSGSRNKYGGQLSKAKYGHSIGNLIRKQNGGQLPRAQFGLTGMGKYPALTATPFDYRTSYGQSSDYNRNPNYSLTYTAPRLFKKADLAGNPLSFTLGRPYNTDAQSLTNRTLNFIPQEGLFSSYYDPATQSGSNPQYQQYLQDVSDTTGTPVSELNQTIINQYNAAKNLAGAKPLYKKGIPLTANIGWDAYGTAFGDSTSGPFTGYGSFNAGYAPEPGFYGTADFGLMGVFGKRKNNAPIKPKRYFDKGLIKQGDRAFIPKLNILNFAVRQRPEYNESQTQQILDAYAKDIEQGTTTAKDFITNKTDEKRFDMSFLSPEATFQIKPFKNIPGVASITGGLRLDYGGKETAGDNIPITPKPYGNVRYTVPLDIELPKNKIAHLFDKGVVDRDGHIRIPKRTYSDYAYNQDYDDEYTEEYTGDTPEEEIPTENNIEVNPPELQVNPNGTVLGKGDCPEGYERPCPKCRCQKIKMPQMYTDKRGIHLFGNDTFQFEDGGVIELELTDDQIEEYRKGGYVVEDISVPSLTRMQPGGLIETAAQLLKQATPGNKVRSLIYSGINPAGYGLKTKLLNFPKELSLTKAANETRPFRVGMSLQNPESLSKFLLRNNMANSDWDALSDLEKMQMMSKPKVDKIVDTGKRRLDAFAVGLKQPQEYGTLEQVGDNTFRMKDISYDPEYFSELYTDILAKNMLDKSGVYLGEDPLVTIAKQHYDRSMHPHLRGLLGIADQTQLGKDAIAKMSKMTRSQIDKLLRYPNRDFAPWKQSRIVELSKINQDPNFKYSIYDNDEFGVMGGFRWDLADTPEGMLWQGNDTWDLNPWQNRGETRVDTDPFVKKLLAQHYRKPLQHLEALSLVGGKPFDIQNNFLIDPGTFKTIKQYQNGGEYGLGDEVDEATMKQLKELGYTFEKI